MKRELVFLAIMSILVMISCSKKSDTAGGGGVVTTDCSGSPKSYATDVSPIIQTSCAINSGCHASGSSSGPGALTNYTQVFNARATIRSAVASGAMPKTGSLTTAQKNNILCWIDNGAPNN